MVGRCRPVRILSCGASIAIIVVASGSNNIGSLVLSNRAHLSRHIYSLGISLRTVPRVNRTVKISF